MIDLNEDRRACATCVIGPSFDYACKIFCKNHDDYMPNEYHDEFGWKIEIQSEDEINVALYDMDVMGNINCWFCRCADLIDPVSSEFCFRSCSRHNNYFAWYPSNGL